MPCLSASVFNAQHRLLALQYSPKWCIPFSCGTYNSSSHNNHQNQLFCVDELSEMCECSVYHDVSILRWVSKMLAEKYTEGPDVDTYFSFNSAWSNLQGRFAVEFQSISNQGTAIVSILCEKLSNASFTHRRFNGSIKYGHMSYGNRLQFNFDKTHLWYEWFNRLNHNSWNQVDKFSFIYFTDLFTHLFHHNDRLYYDRWIKAPKVGIITRICWKNTKNIA